jgi:RNA polymerase sigma factor (sigma-70 family)
MTVKGTPVPDKERDRVFEKFSSLIGPIASRFVQTYRLPKDQTEDLEQEGSIGLLNAARREGHSLTREYANEAIKNEIGRHCKKILASQGRRKVKDPVTGKLVWPDFEDRDDALEIEESNEAGEASEKFQNDAIPANGDYLDCLIVKEALEKLDGQETEVIRLRHEAGLTVRETAVEMGLDKSKVSRIECDIKQKLKCLRQ